MRILLALLLALSLGYAAELVAELAPDWWRRHIVDDDPYQWRVRK